MAERALPNIFELSFDETVPPSLVHKHSAGNVFITDCKQYGNGLFMCAARVPVQHSLFNEGARSPEADILFYSELGRQASIAISHSFLEVGYDQAFIFQESEASLTENFWRSADRSSPAFSVVIEIKTREIKRRKNGGITAVVAEYAMYNQYCQVFRGSGGWLLQSKAMFERFRRTASQGSPSLDREPLQVTMSPSGLGREHATNVVISLPERDPAEHDELVTTLIVDQNHPYFFDHPCDHVPGMLLLEGCAQLTTIAAARSASARPENVVLYAYDIQFLQFIEHQWPVILKAEISTLNAVWNDLLDELVTVSIVQNGIVCGKARMRVAVPGSSLR